jgi:hypothetical protein
MPDTPPRGSSSKVDWAAWHRDYESDTPLRRRLATVQLHIGAVLDSKRQSPLRVISLCAGEARDLLGALEGHARRDIRGRLVEQDADLAQTARQRCAELGLPDVEVIVGDAGHSQAYAGATPADLVLACGVFGNISDEDVERTVRALPMLCANRATVIWTRHRRPPDLTPAIHAWLADSGFRKIAFDTFTDSPMSVGVAEFNASPRPLAGQQLFRFVRQS